MQTPHPLDGVYMSAFARERAKAQMLRAEFFVDLVAHGVSKMRDVIALVVRRAGDICRGRQSPHISSAAASPTLGAL